MLTKSAVQLRILLIVTIAVLLNILFSKFFVRLDFTGDKRYTLSRATKNILRDLQEPVTVTAYFSNDLPPQIEKVRSDFQDLLVEYANRSGGKVVYEFVNPNENQEKEMEVAQQGIQPQVVTVRESDQVKQQRVYLGAKVSYGEAGSSDIIPVIQPGAAMEYALSTAIKKLSATNKPYLGFVTGHGETSIRAIQQAAQQLNVLYNIEPVMLTDTTQYDKYKALVIVAPTDSFAQAELVQLDRFLASGKGLLIALNRVVVDLQQAAANPVSTALEGWLAKNGVLVNEDLVIDEKCGNITVQQQQGFFMFNQQIPFPYLPRIDRFTEHPITRGIEMVMLPFASSINLESKNPAVTYTPLVVSSGRSGAEKPPITFDVQKNLAGYEFYTKNLIMAAALEGEISGSTPSKLVVFSDADFFINGEGERGQQQQPDNINLFANGIDWLADDTGLNELRTKGVTSRPIKRELSKGEVQAVKTISFLLPLVLVILYGIIRSRRRKSQKRIWEIERYS